MCCTCHSARALDPMAWRTLVRRLVAICVGCGDCCVPGSSSSHSFKAMSPSRSSSVAPASACRSRSGSSSCTVRQYALVPTGRSVGSLERSQQRLLLSVPPCPRLLLTQTARAVRASWHVRRHALTHSVLRRFCVQEGGSGRSRTWAKVQYSTSRSRWPAPCHHRRCFCREV